MFILKTTYLVIQIWYGATCRKYRTLDAIWGGSGGMVAAIENGGIVLKCHITPRHFLEI
jgi:hypothetical protein